MRLKFKSSFFFLIAFLTFSAALQAQDVLVISGGGARGAWGGGVAEALCEEKGRQYQKVVGTSTGSLLMPMILLNDFETLRELYTNVRQRDIFNANPFKKRGRKKGKVKVGKAFWRVIWGKKTLGASKRLRRLIRRNFQRDLFKELRDKGKEGFATVVNVTTNKTHYQSTMEHTYKDMVNWIWASANQPVFMSLYKTGRKKDREYWVDGGIKDVVAVDKGIELASKLGSRELDVIVNNTQYPQDTTWREKGIFNLLIRTINILSNDIRESDVRIGLLMAELSRAENRFYEECDGDASAIESQGLIVNVYYMPAEIYNFAPHPLLFEPDKMSQLWVEGRNVFGEGSHYKCKRYKISKDDRFLK